MQIEHPFCRKLASKWSDKARQRFSGDMLRRVLFQIAGFYGATELYGLWATLGIFFHLFIKPLFFGRGKRNG